MKKILYLFPLIAALSISSCCSKPQQEQTGLQSSVVYELNTRQFTPEGTFAAAEQQLPRLKELGVDIVWLMPIYPIGEKGRKGELGSYYAIRNYCDVNPEFGTLADFDSFIATAHNLGLRVIIDWVANHTSPDHPWVTEKPADWYIRDAQGNTIVEYDWTDIAKLNYANADMRQAMHDSMLFWLERGVDGFRCDMAFLVPQDFWTPTIADLRSKAGKELYFLAEGEEPWLHDAGFNTTYCWELHHCLNDIAKGNRGKEDLLSIVNSGRFPSDVQRLHFTSNHDENSWAGTEFERMGDAWKALTVLCWTLPQSQPLIYTGQEVGMDWRFEFFKKDESPCWKENEYTLFYKYLAELKHSHRALDSDAACEFLPCGDDELLYKRSKDGDVLYVRIGLENPWSWSISEGLPQCCVNVEPANWWVGMKTPLQLMLHGEGIGSYTASVKNAKDVKVSGCHKAESPNYLFVDLQIGARAEAGTIELLLENGSSSFTIPYQLNQRREASAQRESFSTKDIMYLIMPDRFVNGDPSNDNSPFTTEKADTKAYFGRHGGDIAGIESQLDYLADLGISTIWNTPLLEDNEPRESYHGYACTNYYRIDPRFGSNESYRHLVKESHKRGIKMVMDIVTNHCGDAHWWMQDLPFADWVHQWPEYTHSNCCFSLQNDPYGSSEDLANMEGGWFDRSMVDMNLDNPYLLQYFKQWAVWWIEWADLDGLRVDTYPYNEKVPMSQWCAAVRNEFPGINIVGEVWTNNVPQLAYWQANNPNRDGFNSNLPSVMNFPLHTAICQAFTYHGKVNWDEGMVKIYDCIANDQYYQDCDNMLIFTGNHDIERINDILSRDNASVKMAYSLIATLRGIPQVLYADEVGAVSDNLRQGHGGLRCMFPLQWEQDAAKKDLHDYIKTLFNWRKTSLAVQQGKTKHFLTRDNCYAYFRYTDSETVFVYFNNNENSVSLPWDSYSEITSRLKGKGVNVIDGSEFQPENCTVPAKTCLIIEFK